jgi:tetratricopeptide (TPR) repeat protein
MLYSLGASSCATRAVRLSGNGCSDAGARLNESWTALQEARSSAGGCVPDRNGVDRCEAMRRQIELLSHECPNNAQTLMANAVLAYDAKQVVKAQQLLDQLFSIQGVYPEAAVLRGRIALEEGNIPFVLKFLAQQIRISMDHAGLREVYASALYLAKRWEEAKAELEIASALGAPKWRIAYHRGLIEEATGHLAEAQRYYEDAVQERPGWKAADSRLKGLRALPPGR